MAPNFRPRGRCCDLPLRGASRDFSIADPDGRADVDMTPLQLLTLAAPPPPLSPPPSPPPPPAAPAAPVGFIVWIVIFALLLVCAIVAAVYLCVMAARQLWERELQDEDDALARYEARLAQEKRWLGMKRPTRRKSPPKSTRTAAAAAAEPSLPGVQKAAGARTARTRTPSPEPPKQKTKRGAGGGSKLTVCAVGRAAPAPTEMKIVPKEWPFEVRIVGDTISQDPQDPVMTHLNSALDGLDAVRSEADGEPLRPIALEVLRRCSAAGDRESAAALAAAEAGVACRATPPEQPPEPRKAAAARKPTPQPTPTQQAPNGNGGARTVTKKTTTTTTTTTTTRRSPQGRLTVFGYSCRLSFLIAGALALALSSALLLLLLLLGVLHIA